MKPRTVAAIAAPRKSVTLHPSQIAIPADAVAAARTACECFAGGIPGVAAKMGMNPRILYNKLSGDEDSYHRLSVADFIRIWLVTGDLAPLNALARVMNCACFPVPDYTGLSDEALLDLLCKVNEEGGQWHGMLRHALADGAIDARERAELRREAYEWIGAIAEAEARLDGLVDG